jgi:hypothetical protein
MVRRVPILKIHRAKYPIVLHLHGRELKTAEDYQKMITLDSGRIPIGT